MVGNTQMKNATLQIVLGEGCRNCILLWVPLHCCILLLSCNIAIGFAIWLKDFRWRVQHCRLSLKKDAGFAFFLECLCIVAFFFFCPMLRPVTRFLTEWSKVNRQKKKNQPADIYRMRMKITTCIIAFFLFCPDSSPVNALCRISLPKGDTYPSDWKQGCNARFEARKKSAFYFCAELVDNASESIVSVFRKAILS